MMDEHEVCGMFDFLDSVMSKFKKKAISVDDELPLRLFVRAFDFLIDNGNHLALARFLQFWYNHFVRMPENQTEVLMNYLIRNHFEVLVFHWAAPVRQAFHHLLIFRCLHNQTCSNHQQHWRQIIKIANEKLNYINKYEKEYRILKLKWLNSSKVNRRLTDPEKLAHHVAFDSPLLGPQKPVNFFNEKFAQVDENAKQNTSISFVKSNSQKQTQFKKDISLLLNDKLELSKAGNSTVSNGGATHKTSAEFDSEHKISKELLQECIKYFEHSMNDFRLILRCYFMFVNGSGWEVERNFPVLKMRIPIDKFENE